MRFKVSYIGKVMSSGVAFPRVGSRRPEESVLVIPNVPVKKSSAGLSSVLPADAFLLFTLLNRILLWVII